MAGNNPRKFKDRIALLAQKEAEGTAQFQEVMREVAEVKHPNPFEGAPTNHQSNGRNIPKHLNPMVLSQNAHYRIHGGSLPNVNQMVTSGHSGIQAGHNTGYQSFGQGGGPDYSSILSLKQTYASQIPERSRTTSMGSPGSGGGNGGGGAIRNRSGDRRWDTSPYGGERNASGGNGGNNGIAVSPYYSANLSPYLSPPPPENRWRRTSSDSALYQSAAAGSAINQGMAETATAMVGGGLMMMAESRLPSQQKDGVGGGGSGVGGGGSETGSPNSITNELILPSLQIDDVKIKEEPGLNGYRDTSCKSPKSPCSPMSPLTPMTPPNSCSPTYHYVPPELESGFQNFGLESKVPATTQAQMQQSASQQTRQSVPIPHSVPQQESKHISPLHLPSLPTTLQTYHENQFQQQNQEIPTPSTDPASPLTPGMLPGFLITDWDNAGYNKQENWNSVQLKQETDPTNPLWNLANCRDNDAQFVENLREGLEPIDEQLLATLTGQTSFVDPAVEEQFKINY